MENHKLKTLTVEYRNQNGEIKQITNHEVHAMLENGFYRPDIAKALQISPAILREIMEALNMWKMRARANAVRVVDMEEIKEAPVSTPEPEIVPEPVKTPVIEAVKEPEKKSRRKRAVKVVRNKRVSQIEADKILQDELDRIRQVRNSIKEDTLAEFRREMQQELKKTVKAFTETMEKAIHFEEINSN
jgi:hypothetical protein